MKKDTGRWLPPRNSKPRGPYSSHMINGKRVVITGATPTALKKGLLKYWSPSRFERGDCVIIDPLTYIYDHLETIAEQVGMTIKYIEQRKREAERSIQENSEVMDNILYDADQEEFDKHKYRRAVADLDATADSISGGFDDTSSEIQSITEILDDFTDMIGKPRYVH